MKKSKIYIILIVLLCITIVVGIAKFAASATDEIPTSIETEAVEMEITEKNPVEEMKAVLIILAESDTKSEAIDKIMQMNHVGTAGDVSELVDAFEDMSIFWDCRECVLYDLEEGLEYGLDAEWIEWYMDTYFPELPESCESYATEETPTPTTDKIVDWLFENYEEITVIFAVISAALLIVARLTDVIKSIVTCNNNSVAVAEESQKTTQTALDEVKSVKDVVGAYKEEIANLLAEVRQSDEEKKELKTALINNENFLKTAKLANTELANEVAELLVLANIPNSKKEELYSRHRAAVDAIEAADKKNTEVKEDVGEEA